MSISRLFRVNPRQLLQRAFLRRAGLAYAILNLSFVEKHVKLIVFCFTFAAEWRCIVSSNMDTGSTVALLRWKLQLCIDLINL
jgi:hypothetical protein